MLILNKVYTMPIVKVKENEPFEVALQKSLNVQLRKLDYSQNFVPESFMKSLLPRENVKKLLLRDILKV